MKMCNHVADSFCSPDMCSGGIYASHTCVMKGTVQSLRMLMKTLSSIEKAISTLLMFFRVKKVDSALDNQKNTKMRRGRRFRKIWKEYRCHIQHIEHSLRQLQTDNGSNYFSVLRLRKRRNSSENTDKQKMKSLNVEDHHNHSTGSSCFHDSVFHEDDTDVLTLKNIDLLDKERGACPVLPERALRRTFRKKLLVLDLNGILCDVVFSSCGSLMPYKKVSKKPGKQLPSV
ncbi:hypothetical protein KSP40_PGU016174 [Platanthera guangdongensis]|uniref:FCP1 homology domain-containing protein n=1 Tax=Platanthera guangdongensis TaxID=2320717 RepID=A0ABR2MF50_9ASPA